MGKIISLLNHKGGVGKTTSAINIGAGLVELGKRTLLIDLDPQANLTLSLGIPRQKVTIYEALRGEAELEPYTYKEGLVVTMFIFRCRLNFWRCKDWQKSSKLSTRCVSA